MNPYIHRVETIGGNHTVRFADEFDVPITAGGQHATFPPGWEPKFVYSGFAPVYLLELVHESGSESTWFLDQDMDRLGFDDLAQLPPLPAAIIRLQGARLLTVIWNELLCSTFPMPGNDIRAFFHLGGLIRHRICLFCEDQLSVRPRLFDLGLIAAGNLELTLGPGLNVRTDVMVDYMRSPFLAKALNEISAGGLSWESPLGGGRLMTNTGIWLPDHIFAYRLIDRTYRAVFFVIFAGSPARLFGFYFPAQQIIFYNPEFANHITGERYGNTVDIWFIRHLCEYGEIMERSWTVRPAEFTAVFPEDFFGTQLWNDLTGIDALVRTVPAALLPEVTLWGPNEVFGKTEELFPEIAHRINRSVVARNLIEHAYSEQRCLIKLTGDKVSRELSTRILDVNSRDPSLEYERVRLARIRDRQCPLVLIGLRVENRTAVDLPKFCVDLIDFILAEAGEVAVIIDGHNSAGPDEPSRVFDGALDHLATERPIDVERKIVAMLGETFKDRPVHIVDKIGAPISHSLFWCRNASFFVTFYGTGLAKYRWACNQTGLIVTSQWSLRHQGQLHIYEEPWLEAASPLAFLPGQYVEDVPDAPSLVPQPYDDPASRWNFHVRKEGVFIELRRLLHAAGYMR